MLASSPLHPLPVTRQAAAGEPAGPSSAAAGAAVGGPLAALAAASQAVAALVEQVGVHVVGVNLEGRGDGGSGTVWRDGLVVTVAHPLGRGRRPVRVTGADGEAVEAALLGLDPATDLALLRLPAGTHDGPAMVARSAPDETDLADVRPGHFVVALGRSVRGDLAASAGIVHRTGGAWQTWTGGRIDRLIRLDGGLFDGLSGGPVADAAGRVIGIANGALARGGGVVVPARTVDRVVDALLAHGQVARPYLGIVAQPVRVPGSSDTGADAARGALLVTALDEQGPAAAAGLLVGDIVVAVDGTDVDHMPGLRAALAGHRPGSTVPLQVLRGGVPTAVSLVAGSPPAAPNVEGCCR